MYRTIDGKTVTDQEAAAIQKTQMQWLENGNFEKLMDAEFLFSEELFAELDKEEK